DATMTAETLTWSRSRGRVCGVSLQGATLRQDIDANTDLHGKAYENAQIVKSGLGVPEAGSRRFRC
ncbi:MAG: hypothetical protein IPJ98_22200, partial [Bryobacterales bacterium]|nr:hypothetical protein [Bryobacterales bacterium]